MYREPHSLMVSHVFAKLQSHGKTIYLSAVAGGGVGARVYIHIYRNVLQYMDRFRANVETLELPKYCVGTSPNQSVTFPFLLIQEGHHSSQPLINSPSGQNFRGVRSGHDTQGQVDDDIYTCRWRVLLLFSADLCTITTSNCKQQLSAPKHVNLSGSI